MPEKHTKSHTYEADLSMPKELDCFQKKTFAHTWGSALFILDFGGIYFNGNAS